MPDEDFELPDASEIDPALGAELAGTTRVTLRLDDLLLVYLKGTGSGSGASMRHCAKFPGFKGYRKNTRVASWCHPGALLALTRLRCRDDTPANTGL
jgi:hypothetical protein